MPQRHNTFLLGLVTLIMLALFVGMLLFLAGIEIGRQRAHYVVRFAHDMPLPRLEPGSPVTCGGLQVGQVTHVWLAEGAPPEAHDDGRADLFLHVGIEIDPVVDLRRDCEIVAVGPLLGGPGTVVIRTRGVSAQTVAAGEAIDGKPTGSLDALLATLGRELDPDDPRSLLATIKTQLDPQQAHSILGKIHRSLDDINQVTRRVSGELDPLAQAALLAKVHRVLDNLNEATSALAEQMAVSGDATAAAKVHAALDALAAALASARDLLEESRPPLAAILENIRSATGQVDQQLVRRLVEQFNPDNPAGILAKVHEAADQVNASLDNVHVVTQTGREIVLVSRPQLLRTLHNLRVISDLLRNGVRYVMNNPWVLFRSVDIEEMRERDVMEAAARFAEAAADLNDAVQHLRALAETEPGPTLAQTAELIQARDNLRETLARFSEAEQAFWQYLSGL